ncbi:hypothetical protein CC86DRAFT_389194 [Ophiobolus disseminans]|uniref:Uncharacterized protein n=1 Tax=Ophiobolus disseminans TaxID=1469910 RepID=A0A6A6ZD05_9PLEO|nr:hypothetical protein CC86DRAFT_389194 [Ophiobolus disseminans]
MATGNIQIAVKPDPDMQERVLHGPQYSAQDYVLRIHQHLVDISQLACQSKDELPQYQLNYKQAYLSEHQKLVETVAAHNLLADTNQVLEKENAYLKHQLIPQYERLLERQARADLEAQSVEVKLETLGKASSNDQEKHLRALEAASSFLSMQTRKIAALEKDVEARLSSSQLPTAQLRRSSRLSGTNSLKRTLRGTKSEKGHKNAKK